VEIIDAWAQHPTPRHTADPIFDSLRRWNRQEAPDPDAEIPVSLTIGAMDEANVSKSLISAWYAPRNVMISNDEVASFVSEAPDRLRTRSSASSTPSPMPGLARPQRLWLLVTRLSQRPAR